MRAVETKGPSPRAASILMDSPLFSDISRGTENSNDIHYANRQSSDMRVESSSASVASDVTSTHRAPLGQEAQYRLLSKDGDRDIRSVQRMNHHHHHHAGNISRGEEDDDDDEADEEEDEEEEESDAARMSDSRGESSEENRHVRKNELEMELATKRREVSHLVDEMERLQSSINSLKEMSTTKISQLEDMVNEKDRIIKDLAEKLLRQQDYSDLKRELRLLKSLEIGGWPGWCNVEQGETASSPIETKLDVPEPHVETPPEESASPCSATAEDPGSVPTTPPSESLPQTRSPAATPDLNCNVSVQRLHRCLRNNVDRFSGESLDTLGIARCVRELLSAHNIGQRMFAKLVLGLSQGTVSELLSKPKPWEKLTEKGRDSYRKMHAWACDQQCIHLLKSLLPRKGRESGLIKLESPSTEDRASTPASDSPNTASITSQTSSDQEAQKGQSKTSSAPAGGQCTIGNEVCSTPDDKCQTPTSCDGAAAAARSGNQTSYHEPHYHHHHGIGHHHHHQAPFQHQNAASGYQGGKQPHLFPACGDFPPMVLAHLYQEELLKLIGKRLKDGYAEDHAKQAQEDVRQALSIYHRELALLAQQGVLQATRPPPNSSPVAHSPPCHTCSTVRRPNCSSAGTSLPPFCPSEQACCRPDRTGLYSVISPYSGTSPLVPLPSEGAQAPGSEETSPLQRMQSITNSLLSQSSSPSFASLPQRPSKAVLPPITQQQFDQYNNLNTEEIVKRVKEQLSQYSISQRLFGENVLGLSQGSVSDLLARPKPWHMLTQKGREPFIRMKMFLEDESAVHKLVASQYKIAPERLMRIGGYGAAAHPPPPPGSHGLPRFGSVTNTDPSIFVPHSRGGPIESHQLSTVKGPAAQQQQQQLQQQPQQQQTMIPSSSSSPQTSSTPESRDSAPPTARSPSGPPAALPPAASKTGLGGIGRRAGGAGGGGGHHHTRCLPCVQPSVYEMAAVTTDLDTHLVTARIKETLTVHNIGQKLFGEAVLGLSQGSVSELLSKPKPWHMLSIKGREPFIRMQLWLTDPSNVEKLQAIKSERREANKRRRSNMDQDLQSPAVHAEKPPPALPPYPIDLPPVFLYPPAKKPRMLFSEEQKEALRLAYSLDSYPSTAVMEFLSNELGLSVRTITNWFHNHRMRLKQQSPDGAGGAIEPEGNGFTRPPGVEAGTFDPIRFRMLLGQRLAEMCTQQPTSNMALMPYFDEPLRLCHQSYPQNLSNQALKAVSDKMDLDDRTLDLSMSSQKYAQKQQEQADSSNLESVHSTSEESPQLCNDDAKPPTSGASLPPENTKQSTATTFSGEALCNMVSSSGGASNHSNNSGGSNRRKAAAPQWVNPGLGLSPESDICSFEDDEDDLVDYEDIQEWKADAAAAADPNHGNNSQKESIINGVCVRQTDLLPNEEQRSRGSSEVVHVVPIPAVEEETVKNERENNIRRLERAIVEQDEGWDFTESEDEDGNETFHQQHQPPQRI